MATESVATATPRPFYLPFDEMSRAGEICAKLRGILWCAGAASNSGDVPDDAVLNACWAASTLVDELQEITGMRQSTNAATA